MISFKSVSGGYKMLQARWGQTEILSALSTAVGQLWVMVLSKQLFSYLDN